MLCQGHLGRMAGAGVGVGWGFLRFLYTRVSLADGWNLSGFGVGESRVLCVGATLVAWLEMGWV